MSQNVSPLQNIRVRNNLEGILRIVFEEEVHSTDSLHENEYGHWM